MDELVVLHFYHTKAQEEHYEGHKGLLISPYLLHRSLHEARRP